MVKSLVALAAVLSLVSAAQQPPRDIRRPAAEGTATIAGVILTGEPRAVPLRRVRVGLTGPDGNRTIAITEDDGTFAFEKLHAGRYTLLAEKSGYVTMAYGAKRANRPGTGIVVRGGEHVRVSLSIAKGAVITGTVWGTDGHPAPGVRIWVMTRRVSASNGARTLEPVGFGQPVTDDRGEYRLYGLAGGEYRIAAQGSLTDGAMEIASAAEIRRALAEVSTASGGARRPGLTQPPRPRSFVSSEPPKLVIPTPVFHPGTPVPGAAAAVTVTDGEERHGIDIQLQHATLARVSGVVASPPDARGSVVVTLNAAGNIRTRSWNTSVGPDGTFTFPRVPPGEYTVTAFTRPVPVRPGTMAPPGFWGETSVLVDGEDITGLGIVLGPGLALSGHLAFAGERPPPRSIGGLQMPLPLVPAALSTPPGAPQPPLIAVNDDGTFTASGLIPGTYLPSGAAQGVRTAIGPWWLTSITSRGRELLDAPLELRQNAEDLVVTFADRASAISGHVRHTDGEPAVDHHLLVFSTDRAAWFPQSRRVVAVRLPETGRYTIRNLPAGDYFVLADDDVEPGEWHDRAFLEQRAARAATVRIDRHEQKTWDIVIRTAR